MCSASAGRWSLVCILPPLPPPPPTHWPLSSTQLPQWLFFPRSNELTMGCHGYYNTVRCCSIYSSNARGSMFVYCVLNILSNTYLEKKSFENDIFLCSLVGALNNEINGFCLRKHPLNWCSPPWNPAFLNGSKDPFEGSQHNKNDTKENALCFSSFSPFFCFVLVKNWHFHIFRSLNPSIKEQSEERKSLFGWTTQNSCPHKELGPTALFTLQ